MLDYTVFWRITACWIIMFLLKAYCVVDYTVSIEMLLRARLYCFY